MFPWYFCCFHCKLCILFFSWKWYRFSVMLYLAILPSSVQLLSCVWLFLTLWTAAHQAFLFKFMSVESVMPSSLLILSHPLPLLPLIFPSISVFSSESALRIRWPKYWSFSFSISLSNEYSRLICFRKKQGDWNAKVGPQEIPGVIGKFGLGVQNEAEQRLTEFSRKNTLVIANTLFQQHKRRLYTWTSLDGQYWNQID